MGRIDVFGLCFFFDESKLLQPEGVNVETVYKAGLTLNAVRIALQLAVVQPGQLVLLKSYGVANLQVSAPVTNQSVFSINSCTKASTSVAIMQLDGLPATWQPITIR